MWHRVGEETFISTFLLHCRVFTCPPWNGYCFNMFLIWRAILYRCMNLYLLPVRHFHMLYYICLQYISVVHKKTGWEILFYTQCSACLQGLEGLKLREPTFFPLCTNTHSHTEINMHRSRILVMRQDEKKKSRSCSVTSFYARPLGIVSFSSMCMRNDQKRQHCNRYNIWNYCSFKVSVGLFCFCSFALFLYPRACVCSIFIPSPCMSPAITHISSFKCCLS